MSKIVLASNNLHKIKEFEAILGRENIELIPQSQLEIPEVPETGLASSPSASEMKDRHVRWLMILFAVFQHNRREEENDRGKDSNSR